MKILHVITTLQTGGAEKLMVDLLPRFKAMGHQVDLCVFNGERTAFYEQLENAEIRIIPLASKGSVYNPFHMIRLWKLMRNYDVVHTHNTACQLFAAICSVLCSVVLVTTEHNTSNRRRQWKWYARVDKWMYSRYKKVISISDATEANLRDFIGDRIDKIQTIYNGIDVAKYANAKPIDRTSVTDHPERTIITMVAGFRYQKDHETVIRAASHLQEGYEIWFVGDGERRNIIEAYIKEYGVEDRVQLLGIRTDVPSVLKASDIVVMSSHWEGFGLAAVEGMAAGKPVVASDVAGISQVVDGAGILFPHGDEKALAYEIVKLTTDDAYRNEIVKKCQERAMQYDICTMAKNYNKVYKELSK